MDGVIPAIKVVVQIMDLGMAVVTGCDAIRCSCGLDLIEFYFTIGVTRLRISRLEVSAAPSTAIVVGPVGGHINKVLFTDNGLDHESQVFGHRISKGFSHQLAGILHCKFDLEVLVPIGIDFELSIPDPPGVKPDDALYLEVVGDIEFFQSGPDCK
jgi:hypothetical protein